MDTGSGCIFMNFCVNYGRFLLKEMLIQPTSGECNEIHRQQH